MCGGGTEGEGFGRNWKEELGESRGRVLGLLGSMGSSVLQDFGGGSTEEMERSMGGAGRGAGDPSQHLGAACARQGQTSAVPAEHGDKDTDTQSVALLRSLLITGGCQ